jgi:ATP-dependent exoDNAse (exonuclease V) beta subunit
LQAQDICSTIESIKQNNKREGKNESIAILVRSKNHTKKIIPKLIERNIGYQAVEIDSLKETPHITELINLCSVLLHPSDELSWFGILRSSLLGVENKHLLEIKKHCLKENLSTASFFMDDKKLPKLESQLDTRLKDVCSAFNQSYKNLKQENLAWVLEKLWLNLGGPASVSEKHFHDCKVFFSLVARLNNESTTLDKFSIQMACEQLYAEQKASSENPVFILSIHKSKGLEFDHVIIPSLEKQSRSDDKNLINWQIYQDSKNVPHLLLAPLQPSHFNNNETLLYDYLDHIEKQKGKNERARLLYVACTRAKQSLHLYASQKQRTNKDGEVELTTPGGNSLIALIWESLEKEDLVYLEPEKSKKQNNITSGDYQLKRLAHNWKNIDLLRDITTSKTDKKVVDTKASVFEEVSASAATGTLTHLCLKQLVLGNYADLETQNYLNTFNHSKQLWIKLIQEEGIFDKTLIENIILSSYEMMEKILSDKENAWIFSNKHESSMCEESIYTVLEEQSTNKQMGQVKELIIDRSFIKEGKRWIIDYKTSSPKENKSLEDFHFTKSN